MKAVYLKDKTGNKIVTTPYYRVGDLFLTTIATNPSNYLGGKWELFGPGRCLVCVDTSDSDFNSVKKTGGAKTKTTGNCTLTVEQIPAHTHKIKRNGNYSNEFMIDTGKSGQWGSEIIQVDSNYTAQPSSVTIDNTGGGKSHNHGDLNILQPYITCYIWIRTA